MEDGRRLKTPPLAWLVIFVAVAILAGAVSGSIVALLVDGGEGSSGGELPVAASPASGDSNNQDAIARVVAAAMPAVVTILNEGGTHVDADGNTVQSVSSGSGVVIDNAGFVVTNEHVVHEPGTLSVVLSNGEQRPATVVSTDAPFTDLAVLRIPGGGLKSLALGDSDKLVQGQPVIAIGSALFEYSNSVTTGVVSGLKRRYLREGIYMEDLIQTDAAVNTGNSGGPLLTLDGRVVGLVSNVVRRIAGAENVQGIAFAISSRTMAPVLDGILHNGSFPRPYFGIQQLDLDVPTAQQQGLSTSEGALVQQVFAGSPAEKAGIQAGDIITVLGNSEVNEDFTFLNALALAGPSDRVPVRVLRHNQPVDVFVQLVPRSE